MIGQFLISAVTICAVIFAFYPFKKAKEKVFLGFIVAFFLVYIVGVWQ